MNWIIRRVIHAFIVQNVLCQQYHFSQPIYSDLLSAEYNNTNLYVNFSDWELLLAVCLCFPVLLHIGRPQLYVANQSCRMAIFVTSSHALQYIGTVKLLISAWRLIKAGL